MVAVRGDRKVSDTKLGVIIDETAQRDAIHIAVAPVIASQILAAGDHIGFLPGSTEEVAGVAPTITPLGIVDPYLRQPVGVGQRFWMFLYPQTVTGMRHHWTHPAFEAQPVTGATADSRAWIEAFAVELDQTYNRLMAAAEYWLDGERDGVNWNDNYTYDNSETYKRVDSEKWPIFWKHYEIVTGVTVKNHGATFFTCSC
jgi:hypothetical protein